jgi:hypothetical protein
MSEDHDIPVLASDLESLRLLLTTVYNANSAQDLLDEYRKLAVRHRQSALTQAIQDALAKVEAYLELDKEADDGE